MIARTLLAALLVVLGLGACGDDSGSSTDATGTWTLTSGSGRQGEVPIVENNQPVMLVVDESGASGQGPCNTYQGLSFDDGSVSGAAASTRMACEDDVMLAESAYFAALEAVEAYEVDGDTLTLTGPDAELTFERS